MANAYIGRKANLSAGALNADLFTIDASAHNWFAIQVAGTWSGTLTAQVSNDGVTWFASPITSVTNTGGGSVQNNITANGVYHGPALARYLRVRMTAYTSGSATGTLELSPEGNVFQIFGVAATQSGTWAVNEAPRTTGGLTIHRTISAATTNATSVKGSAGQVYAILASNINAAVRYLKLYNKATAPTVGTDTPVMTIALTGGAAGNVIAQEFPNGLAFSLGIGLALTVGVADADTAAVAATEQVVHLFYA